MSQVLSTPSPSDGTRTISVTSGKGGVGKTTLICNVAAELARAGKKVLILDGDLGMANVDIFFGQRQALNVGHVINQQCEIEDIIVEVSKDIFLIPGGSGIYGINRLDPFRKHFLLDQIGRLNRFFDFMLIDTAPGIDENVLYLNAAAQEILVVLTPDPASITDAYGLIKVLNRQYRETHFSVVVNMVQDENEGRMIFQKLSDVASRFICVSLDYKGSVPSDPILRQSIRQQRLVVQMQERCPSSLAIRAISEKLKDSRRFSQLKGGLQFFWQQMSGVA